MENESRMHSIQEAKEEEDEEFENYGKGMRTGLSIEDDDQDDDFNKREATTSNYNNQDNEDLDDRADIEDMVIAGTKTQMQYQDEIAKTCSPNKSNNQTKTLNQDLEEAYEDIEEKKIENQTIPIVTNNNMTQFSVHNSDTYTNLRKQPEFINYNKNDDTTKEISSYQHDNTKFSIKKTENNNYAH